VKNGRAHGAAYINFDLSESYRKKLSYMKYTVFIDESGEAGIAKVRNDKNPGASPYFVLGAAVFQNASELHARKVLFEIKDKIGKTSWKHATDLNHADKVYLGRKLGKLPTRYFAVISNKDTLK